MPKAPSTRKAPAKPRGKKKVEELPLEGAPEGDERAAGAAAEEASVKPPAPAEEPKAPVTPKAEIMEPDDIELRARAMMEGRGEEREVREERAEPRFESEPKA